MIEYDYEIYDDSGSYAYDYEIHDDTGYVGDGNALVISYEGNRVWSSNSVGFFGSCHLLLRRL